MAVNQTLTKYLSDIDAAIETSITTGGFIPDRLIQLRNQITANSVSSGGEAATSVYQKVLTAPDLLKTIEYADIGDPKNERVTSIVISSSSLGISFTDTYTYEGVIGSYRITKIERVQANG